MRTWLLVAASVFAGGCYRGTTSEVGEPTPPRQPSENDARTAGKRFVTAVRAHDVAALRGMLDGSVQLARVEFETDRCRRLGDAQPVKTEQLATLASCLGELDRDISTTTTATVAHRDSRWAVQLAADCVTYTLDLAPKPDGALAIAGIASETTCVEGGVEGGVVGGVVGGDLDGNLGAPPPPPPPPPPPGAVTNVPPTLLEGNRIAGDKLIVPDDLTKAQIATGQKDRFVGSFKLCVDITGTVKKVSLLKSTGLPDYDAKLQREMQKWRYRPYEVNGKPVPVCTAVTFIYTQAPPPAPKRPPPP